MLQVIAFSPLLLWTAGVSVAGVAIVLAIPALRVPGATRARFLGAVGALAAAGTMLFVPVLAGARTVHAAAIVGVVVVAFAVGVGLDSYSNDARTRAAVVRTVLCAVIAVALAVIVTLAAVPRHGHG